MCYVGRWLGNSTVASLLQTVFAFTAAWSQNVDSAASMYGPPTLPLTLDLMWGEDYQDLSSWCSKLQPETAPDTEGYSFTAQDNELNTPEVGM